MKGIGRIIRFFELPEPVFDQLQDAGEIQTFVGGRVLAQIVLCEAEESCGRFEAIFLEVHESAGELDQSFVKQVIGLAALSKPEFLQHIVRFVKKLLVEAFEIPQVMRVKVLPLQRLNHLGDARAFFTHARNVGEGWAEG